MRATVTYGAGDVRVDDVPDARLVEPTDALVTVTSAAIYGSDLWPYKSMEPSETGRRMGHRLGSRCQRAGASIGPRARGRDGAASARARVHVLGCARNPDRRAR